MRGGCFVVLGIAAVVFVACGGLRSAAGAPQPPETADANPPVGTVLNPLPGAWVGNEYYLDLRVRFTDPDGINSFSLSMTIDNLSLPSYWSDFVLHATVYWLPEGSHAVEARAWDSSGNGPTVVVWTFQVDATRPSVTITTPSGNPELPAGSVTLAWTGSDELSGIDRYEVTLDDGPSLDMGLATTLPFPDLAPGVHYFSVEAYDVAGNYNSTTAVATVPGPPTGSTPQVTVIVGDQTPLWAIALVAINVVEAAAIAWLAFGRRRPPPGTPGP